MTPKEMAISYRAEILLCGILLLSSFLNIWNIWNSGFSNTYYAAAVRSMLENPGAAFFNSFDAAGFVTIDNPRSGSGSSASVPSSLAIPAGPSSCRRRLRV
jgi:hypothetical protein